MPRRVLLARVPAWLRAIVLCWLATSAMSALAQTTVVDDRGVRVSFAKPPQRIVSLLPSLTEMVCALGACGRLVAVDRYANYPPDVVNLPKSGGLDDANVELIVSLKPDVVLLARSSRVTDRLEALGLKVVALEPRSYDDVQRVADKVAQVLDLGDAGRRLWRAIEAEVARASAEVPAAAHGLRVYYEVDSAPYAAGEASFIGETLTRLGVRNIVPAQLGPFPKLNPEYVVRADPDVIMLSSRHADGLSQRPGWARIRAIQNQRVCAFTQAQSDVLSRPGPRMGEAAQIMARCLQDVVQRSGGRP